MTPYDEPEMEQALRELFSLSDRASGILALALIDDELERFACRVMVDPDDDTFGSGILGTASEKMDALFQFGFLPKEIFHDLTLLRRIRNVFGLSAIKPAGSCWNKSWVWAAPMCWRMDTAVKNTPRLMADIRPFSSCGFGYYFVRIIIVWLMIRTIPSMSRRASRGCWQPAKVGHFC